jgi:hypothetical protein
MKLPITLLSAAQVFARTGIPEATLTCGVQKDLYSVTHPGFENDRAYPAWQFVEPVRSAMPHVLDTLSRQAGVEIHAFFVTEQEELNDLSPAELLTGMQFEPRTHPAPAQTRLLALPSDERLQMVLGVARLAMAHVKE